MKTIDKAMVLWNGSVQEFSLIEKGEGLYWGMITRTTHPNVGYARHVGNKAYIMRKWRKIIKTGSAD